jgi:hypothetical protein
MPQSPQNEDFDEHIAVELAGERYTVSLEKWIQLVSVGRDNMLQFLQENDSLKRISSASAFPQRPVASESIILQSGKLDEKPSFDQHAANLFDSSISRIFRLFFTEDSVGQFNHYRSGVFP